jgi:hypothetical protein
MPARPCSTSICMFSVADTWVGRPVDHTIAAVPVH